MNTGDLINHTYRIYLQKGYLFGSVSIESDQRGLGGENRGR